MSANVYIHEIRSQLLSPPDRVLLELSAEASPLIQLKGNPAGSIYSEMLEELGLEPVARQDDEQTSLLVIGSAETVRDNLCDLQRFAGRLGRRSPRWEQNSDISAKEYGRLVRTIAQTLAHDIPQGVTLARINRELIKPFVLAGTEFHPGCMPSWLAPTRQKVLYAPVCVPDSMTRVRAEAAMFDVSRESISA